jgi:SAM-dependent methyltransferase
MGVREEARLGFGTARAVAAYERGRPGYPPAAVAELVSVLAIGPRATVLDLAAGSGKLTRQLLPARAGLVAVEPSPAMRERLAAATPGVRVLEGTAEAIPLPDGSLDAVTVGQAFHWFDGPRAVAELHRVLRPGGRVGLLWNVRDESVPWMARITAIIDRHAGDTPRYRDGRWRTAFDASAGFTPLQVRRFATGTSWTGRGCSTASPRSASSPPCPTRPGRASWPRSSRSSRRSRPWPGRGR